MDLFTKILENKGHLGAHSDMDDNYYMFPKLEGNIGNHCIFLIHCDENDELQCLQLGKVYTRRIMYDP